MGDVLEQVFEWSKVVLPIKTVHIVIDGNKPHTIAGEYQFGQLAYFQILTAQTAEILDDHCAHHTVLHQPHDFVPSGTVEIGTGETVIS